MSYLKGFKWSGPKYRRCALPENDWPTTFFDTVDIAPTNRIVQVGAWDTVLTKRLSDVSAFTLALEFDDTLFNEAIRNPSFSGTKKTMFIKADPCAVPSNAPHAPFDILFSHIALERCHNMTRLLSRFIRLIKEGGQVYFEISGAKDMEELYRVIVEVAKQNEFAKYFGVFRFPHHRLDEQTLRRILVETGYGEESVSHRVEERTIEAGRFAEWVMLYPAHPWVEVLPEGQKMRFAEAVAQRYPQKGGSYLVTRSILTGSGKRLWGDLAGDLYPTAPGPADG